MKRAIFRQHGGPREVIELHRRARPQAAQKEVSSADR